VLRPSTWIIFLTFLASLIPVFVATLAAMRFRDVADEHSAAPLTHRSWMFAACVSVGAIGGLSLGALVAPVYLPSFDTADPLVSTLLSSGVVGPIAEEMGKASLLLGLFIGGRLKTRGDGLILGLAAGAGFAAYENLLFGIKGYASGGVDTWLAALRIRMGYGTLIHLTSSALFGATLGGLYRRGSLTSIAVAPLLGLLAAVLVHGGWNTGIEMYAATEEPMWAVLSQLIAFAALLVVIILLRIDYVRAKKRKPVPER
jgi:RsiW-degrading membrane proteinase PrsW (M82 family)